MRRIDRPLLLTRRLGVGFDTSKNTANYQYSRNATRIDKYANSGTHSLAVSALSHNAGKWVIACTLTSEAQSDGMVMGFVRPGASTTSYPGVDTNGWSCQFNRAAGVVSIFNNGFTAITPSTISAVGDTAYAAIDIDAGKCWFGRNGVWFNNGDPAAGTNQVLNPVAGSTYTIGHSDAYIATRDFFFDQAPPHAIPAGYALWGMLR